MTSPGAAPAAQSLRIMVGALLAAPFVLLVTLVLVLPPGDATLPPPLTILALLLPVAVASARAERVGFRTPPLDPSEPRPVRDAQRSALAAHQRLTLVRFAICEAPLLIALVASFVLADHALWPYAVVLLPAAALMAFETWPTRRTVERTAAALEARGARSHLREAFGHA